MLTHLFFPARYLVRGLAYFKCSSSRPLEHGPLGPLALTDLARLPGLLCLGSAELVLPCSLPCFALPMLPTSLIREAARSVKIFGWIGNVKKKLNKKN